MRKHKTIVRACGGLTLAATLVACGGGGSDTVVPPPAQPGGTDPTTNYHIPNPGTLLPALGLGCCRFR